MLESDEQRWSCRNREQQWYEIEEGQNEIAGMVRACHHTQSQRSIREFDRHFGFEDETDCKRLTERRNIALAVLRSLRQAQRIENRSIR